jgi:hypothetical protein
VVTPSATYKTIWRAIRERKQITCVFEGRHREACPVILGYSSDGRERALVFQIGGQTRRGSKLPGWRSFRLAGVRDLKLRDGPWTEGDSHTRTQPHIRFVDVDVNIPATLTRPQPLPFGSPELLPPRGR